MPTDLVQMYLGNDVDGKEFITYIRSYNNMFAFTSIGIHCDKSLATRNNGIYTCRVQGQVYHFMDQLIPSNNQNPKNLQLYFYDTEHEILNRMYISSKFKETVVKKLTHILSTNPYVNFFRSLSTIQNLNAYKIALEADPSIDQRVFNKPTVSQVAGIWLENDESHEYSSQHIQIYPKNSETQIIKHYFACYDPLIFPNGESGWHRNIKRLNERQKRISPRATCDGENIYDIQNFTTTNSSKKTENKRSTVSCREYYCYKLQIRKNDKSFLLHTGRLLQQYVIDMYIKIETSRLEFFRTKDMQQRLRNEIYCGLLDSMAQGLEMGSDIGKRTILPASFIGGPRDMRKRYMDAITLVQRYGKPDIFLTMTSNPNWPEIKALCLPSDEVQNRPDLIARIFQYFTWHRDIKEWEPRKRDEVISRIFSCHPTDGKKFYLKLLLMHIRKPTSFKDLQTINGVTYATFREAAQILGLMEDNNTIDNCIQEATAYLMPTALRQLFATVLVYCNPKNPEQLWLKYENFLSQDFVQDKSLNPCVIRHKVLNNIAYYLYSMGKRLEDFFSTTNVLSSFDDNLTKELQTEKDIIIPNEDLLAIKQLNAEQKYAYDRILYYVNNNLSQIFFVDGAGGTEKTFLYKEILATIRSAGHIALATATSDIKINNIDEATMAKRSIIENFDEMLRDIMNTKTIFGGKIIVFGGDFRQTLPVILKSNKDDIIDSSIVMSPLWKHFEKIKLKQNMRALLDPKFSSYLLRVGDGVEETNERDEILIPPQANIPFIDEATSLNILIDNVFPNIDDENLDFSLFVKRAILTTRNEFVNEINDVLITKFPGEETTYYSCDENISACIVPDQEELFHFLTPQGLPPHKLTLKLNAPIILLLNINPTEGLCNGTRLLCKGFNTNVIYAEISVGIHAGKAVFIPRITLETPHDNLSSIPFKRKQFPIRLCFVMTINKAQGQTLDFVGVYLKEPVFSHGQLYVALSRAKTIDQLKVDLLDGTGNISAYVENEEAEMLLGASAEKVMETKHEEQDLNPRTINEKIKDLQFLFQIRTIKNETRGKTFVRNTIVKCLQQHDSSSSTHSSKELTSPIQVGKDLVIDMPMIESQESTSKLEEEHAATNPTTGKRSLDSKEMTAHKSVKHHKED
ncbi:uncharacterized protein [Henckelia pumila]|uniref:uncharacterized protein n=1 Tax=Henckelia pumila TaxID=405737 RepID=UPI003C6DFB48